MNHCQGCLVSYLPDGVCPGCQHCAEMEVSYRKWGVLPCSECAETRETYARIVAGQCAPDEQHCSCVPALRERIAALEADVLAMVEALVTRDESRIRAALARRGVVALTEGK